MKILVLTNLYPPAYIGGYELICQTVVEGLRQRGHQIEILTSDHQRRRACPSEVEPPVDRSLRIHGLYGHPWRGVLRLSSIERHNNARLRDTLMQSKPDLVYVWNMGGLSKSMLFTLQQTGIPTVFYVSDHWISRSLAQDVWLRWWQATDRDPARKLLRLAMHISGLQRAWLRRAPAPPVSYLAFRRIYFCSRALRALTASAGYAVGHGAVIPPPIHPRYLQSAPVPPPAQLERLLYVGRLTQDKGVLTALRAVALVARPNAGAAEYLQFGRERLHAAAPSVCARTATGSIVRRRPSRDHA
ncbi:MAG: glycosyltransferase [Verrucomicrobiota bacterium]